MCKRFTFVAIILSIACTTARRRKSIETGPGPEWKIRTTTPTQRQKPDHVGGSKDEGVSSRDETTTKAPRKRDRKSRPNQSAPEWIPSHTPTKYYAGYAWRESYDSCLPDNDAITETFTIPVSGRADAPERCLQLCLKSSTLECWSVDYQIDVSQDDNTLLIVTCILSEVSRVRDPTSTNVDVTCCKDWMHFEKVPGWIWKDKPGVTIQDGMLDKKSMYAETFETCKEACAAETDFICMSVEWKSALGEAANSNTTQNASNELATPFQRNCHLQARWSSYPKQMLSIDNGNSYAEKAVESSTGWAWTSVQDACISGHDNKIIGGVPNFEDCRARCRNELDFVCRSVEYKDGTCRLSLADSSDTFHYQQPCGTAGTEYSQKNL
ncbi:unnamed protein product [Owenia fusiformis]|uniref:Uncharacterized protein n=1 Tax=Owenia fusiformis TaxID=6347 RepID=A0A8J1UBC4_OWEFU|nr:unnamed protein product [Owenia fusiformis]